jgi:hypothetical protein
VSKKKRSSDATESTIYVVLVGLNYGDPEKRVEVGAEVTDLPTESIPWLLEQGYIRPKEVE